MSTALVSMPNRNEYRPATVAPKPLPLNTLDDVVAYAGILFNAGMMTKDANNANKLAVKILAGREVGLSPVQSLNWIMLCNGRATIYGDAALALIRASGYMVSIKETYEGNPGSDGYAAVCVTQRIGDHEPRETRFSIADAKKAKLLNKPGPWTEYTDRQLMFRARGWNLRDNFGDVLCGLTIYEEESDYEPQQAVKVQQVPAQPATSPAIAAAAELPTLPICCVSDTTLEKIADARDGWLRSIGVDPENAEATRAAWLNKLADYGVKKAAQLSADDGEKLFRELLNSGLTHDAKAVFGDGPQPGN